MKARLMKNALGSLGMEDRCCSKLVPILTITSPRGAYTARKLAGLIVSVTVRVFGATVLNYIRIRLDCSSANNLGSSSRFGRT